jgi:hypothetical protein
MSRSTCVRSDGCLRIWGRAELRRAACGRLGRTSCQPAGGDAACSHRRRPLPHIHDGGDEVTHQGVRRTAVVYPRHRCAVKKLPVAPLLAQLVIFRRQDQGTIEERLVMVDQTHVTSALESRRLAVPDGRQPAAGSRTTTATWSTTVPELLHAVPYTASGDTSIRAARSRSDRSGAYEPADALVKKPGRRAARWPSSCGASFRPC